MNDREEYAIWNGKKYKLLTSCEHEFAVPVEETIYVKALKEIREIAKIAFIVCDDECGNANKFVEIQDKINEVLK